MPITFSVPVKEKLLIKQGQEVDFSTALFKKDEEEEKIISLSQLLNISPQKIFLYLKKFVGEEISRGDLIAEKKGLLDKNQYFSEYDGVLKEIDHEKGNLIITTHIATKQVKHAYFKGKVEEIKQNEVTLATKETKKFSLKETTMDFGGVVLFADEESLGNLAPEEVKNKIIVIESIKPYNQSKLEVMGAAGFVSMQSLQDTTPPPFARVKDDDDWEEIKKVKLPHCLVDKKTNTIYFYQSA